MSKVYSSLSELASRYANRFVSRWLILAFDMIGVGIAFILAYLIRINFNFDSTYVKDLLVHGPTVLFFYLLFFLIFGSYRGIIRHTSNIDAMRIIGAATSALLVNSLVTIIARNSDFTILPRLPHSINIIHYLLVLFALLSSRFLVKVLYRSLSKSKDIPKVSVLIYGLSEPSQRVAQMFAEHYQFYQVKGFVAIESPMSGKTMLGYKCFDLSTAKALIANGEIQEFIIGEEIKGLERKQIYSLCLEYRVKVKSIPPINQWIEGRIEAKQLQQVAIEDLLGRSEVNIHQDHIASEINDAVILVTGAAGSIGSEIVRQLLNFRPKLLLLLDIAETGLHDLDLYLKERLREDHIAYEIIVGDICDDEMMREVFTHHKIDFIYHAAAYKHVPLMERHPHQALKVNFLATLRLAEMANKNLVSKFVFISTDKAVNPSNVMGASKRLAEMALNYLQNDKTNLCSFVSVRFGNVMGSNGSVIPLFKKQIESGGPITVTHKDVTRFFMTIPEASQLVLEAGAMGKGGELFLLDMGEPVKIFDIVKKMVHFSGLELGKDIEIKYTGLRPGEKLFEELLAKGEHVKPTHNPKICIGASVDTNRNAFERYVQSMDHNFNALSSMDIVKGMKAMIPEYKSENSVFQTLDN